MAVSEELYGPTEIAQFMRQFGLTWSLRYWIPRIGHVFEESWPELRVDRSYLLAAIAYFLIHPRQVRRRIGRFSKYRPESRVMLSQAPGKPVDNPTQESEGEKADPQVGQE